MKFKTLDFFMLFVTLPAFEKQNYSFEGNTHFHREWLYQHRYNPKQILSFPCRDTEDTTAYLLLAQMLNLEW